MSTEKQLTFSAAATKDLGRKLAGQILKEKQPRPAAVVIALQGELGAGKTTFVQGFARGLRVKQRLNSPTFVIMKKYKIFNFQFSIFKHFYHIDCYRIENAAEILELGFKEIIADPKNIVAVEWPEKIKRILPQDVLLARFAFWARKKDGRKISFVRSKRFG